MDALLSEIDNLEITQEKLDLLSVSGWKWAVLIVVIVFVTIVALTIKLLVLNYVFFYAPRDRPINTLLAIDQVIEVMLSACGG